MSADIVAPATIRICDARSGKEAERDASGAFLVHDQVRYVVQVESKLVEHGRVLQIQHLSDGLRGTLYFENYVGLAEISGFRFRVRHSKLTQEAFMSMLDGVVRDVGDLAFDYASPTALPFERDDLTASTEVRYHALAYLRYVMLRADDRLHGQFLQIARHPHRRMEHDARWMSTARATSMGPAGLMAIASHPERLVPLPAASRLSQTGLGRALGHRRALFPGEVLVPDRTESFDTHENRLVLHVLRGASDLIADFEGRTLQNPDLRVDLRIMREEIDWMLSFDFLREVGPMQLVPSQSSVLQRREGYRDFLGHFIRLSLSSVLADDHNRWHALLDLKNGALLYELWCFFEVKRTLDALLGKPDSARLITSDAMRRKVDCLAALSYQGGNVELAYNRTYSSRSGSYSVTLRPDVVVRVRRSNRWETLILDAKLKFEGARMDELDDKVASKDEEPSDWKRSATRGDLYKMHTYRDAIREAVGAFVLYPGSDVMRYPEQPLGPTWVGVGALPLDPGHPTEHLRDLLAGFLAPSSAS